MDRSKSYWCVHKKKRLYHVFLGDKTVDNWRHYLIAKKAAKKAVAATKDAHYDNISKQLDAKDGSKRFIYRLARSRQRQTEDVEKFYGVNDEHGHLLPNGKKAKVPITVGETISALKRMEPGEATGPDDVAAELWKSRHWNSAEWLTAFFNKCGFVANCGTTDAIHAARLLIEKHREKQKPVHLVFLDLEKAFDRVSREAIWYALRWQGVPEELIEWVRILYADPSSRVQAAAGTSAEFRISVGVHQGSALSPLLFILVMDAITRDLQRPAPWNLLYADDVMLASEQKEDLQWLTQAWSERLARFGLRLNVKKTEYMTTNFDELSTIQVDGNDLRRTDYFKYLGSTLSADSNLAHEVVARVNATWLKWRSMTGVLCDKNIPDRFKSKVYRAVVRSVAVYGEECWPATKEVERRLIVLETMMLRWTAGVTRADRIRIEKMRERFGIAPIADKLRETRLR
ncbi:hypothetical protein Y032_0296g1688 [Ancylostoma ceylanicum]|uniref:Reverse transcriptase domain-containing protein n=2 Tax=Ancylostoma ceylanicum TaxID=53326 RepID=A0A016S4K7_9BILA|nr:hypothetical protein Y032_0296g1688 [Ancylostoma ceylanicum]